jgi:hypothetical protein
VFEATTSNTVTVMTDAEEDLCDVMREEKSRGNGEWIQLKRRRNSRWKTMDAGYRVIRLARVRRDAARSRDEGRDARVRERFKDFPCFCAPALSEIL